MDQQTRNDLKQNNFITTTGGGGLAMSSATRRSAIVTTAVLLAVVIVAVVIGVVMTHRSNEASVAFGAAMQTYETSLATPGQPPLPGEKTFPTMQDRAKAANAQFLAVADKYGSTADGRNARYFAGITYMEEGQTTSAEASLKQVAGSWDGNAASLAKMALADLYHQTGRDQQAIDIYNELTKKPTDSVPAGLAQIQLAELYTAEGKIDQAHTIYAQLKDKDAKGAAGIVAAQKLNPAPAAGAAAPQL